MFQTFREIRELFESSHGRMKNLPHKGILNRQMLSPCLTDFSSNTFTGFPKTGSRSSLIHPLEQLHHVRGRLPEYLFTSGQ